MPMPVLCRQTPEKVKRKLLAHTQLLLFLLAHASHVSTICERFWKLSTPRTSDFKRHLATAMFVYWIVSLRFFVLPPPQFEMYPASLTPSSVG